MYSTQIKKVVNYFKNESRLNKIRLVYHKFYKEIIKETNFLPEKSIIAQRFYHVLNNTKKIPKCPECSKQVKWISDKKLYRVYCSIKCSKNSEIVKKKYKQTNLKKYNVENVSQSKIIKNKKINTSLKNYGVKNPSQSKIIKNQIKTNNLKKFGVEYPIQKHLSKNTLDKLKDSKYLKYQHHNLKKPLIQIAKELGLANGSSINPYFKKYNIPVFIQSSSILEKEILNYIKSIYSKKIVTNSRSIIQPKELDIYLPEEKLAIEFNGLYWHSNLKKDKQYHIKKTIECLKKNINLIHIFEDEWLNDKDVIKLKLKRVLNLLPEIDIKKCQIINFLKKNYVIKYKNKFVLEVNFKHIKNNNYYITHNIINNRLKIKNGFKFIVSNFIKDNNPNKILGSINLNWTTNITNYKNNNFKFAKYIKSNKKFKKINNTQYLIYDCGTYFFYI